MKRSALYFLVLLAFSSTAQVPWTKLSSQSHTFSFNTGNVFVVDGIAYYINLQDKSLWGYDMRTDSWEQKGVYPGSHKYSITTFAAGGFGYAFGRDGYINCNEMWQYNPRTAEWKRKADVPWYIDHSTVATVGNIAYIATGDNWDYCSSEFWAYDGTKDSWTQLPHVPIGRTGGYTFVLKNKVYIGGGWWGYAQRPGRLFAYNISDSTWQQVDPEPTLGPNCQYVYWDDTDDAMAFVVDGKAYLVGAHAHGKCENAYKVYDPIDNVWKKLPPNLSKRTDIFGFEVDGRGFVGFGSPCNSKEPGAFHNDFYTFGNGWTTWTNNDPVISGIMESEASPDFKISQNKNELIVQPEEVNSLQIKIFNISGQCVFCSNEHGTEIIKINKESFPEGIYTLQCTGDINKTKKFIITN